jgi:hypothetical protein
MSQQYVVTENINIYTEHNIMFIAVKQSFFLDRLTLQNGPTASPKMGVNYQHILHNIPEVWRPHTKH